MFTSLARKINLFNRDRSLITRSDVILTYIFIISTLYLTTWFSVKYYDKSKKDIAKCNDSSFECVKTEIIHLVVPFTGIVYGFIGTSYKACDLFSSCMNYFCCCLNCYKQDENQNIITVEMNPCRVIIT